MAIFRCSLQIEVNSVQTANVVHFEELAVGSDPDRENAVNNYLTGTGGNQFSDAWKAAFSVEASITCVKVQERSPTLGTARVFFQELVGLKSGDCSPSQLCAVVRLYSALGTKRGRGRHFFAGIPESGIDGGNYEPSYLNTDLAAFLTAFDGTGFSEDGSQYQANVFSKLDAIYRNAIQWIVDPIPRNQRDRTTKLCGS